MPVTGTSSTSSWLGRWATTVPRGGGAQGCKGRHFIQQRPLLCFSSPARPHYDVVMFDVDSKDPTLGMSCPPPAFVEQPFLQRVKRILAPEGVGMGGRGGGWGREPFTLFPSRRKMHISV